MIETYKVLKKEVCIYSTVICKLINQYILYVNDKQCVITMALLLDSTFYNELKSWKS